MENILKKLKKDGFVKANNFGLKPSEAKELAKLSNDLFEKYRSKKIKNNEFSNYSPPFEGSEVISRFPEHDKRIFEIIENILKNKNFKNMFEKILGKNFKLRQCSLRRSLPGDNGLYLHQDAIGETNLTILLSDNLKGHGSTCFLPGSHLVQKRMKEWNIEAPPILVKMINFAFKKTPGLIGDCYIFFNRTWHGRSSNKCNKEHDVILISFFPKSVDIPGYDWCPNFIKSIKNTEFSKRIDFQFDHKNIQNQNNNYASDIEIKKFKVELTNLINVYFTIFFLRTFFAIFRPIYRFIKYQIFKTK